ncbi:MAG: hypothetical protein U9Q39_01635 [Pseudomonadota bacterium]|nr:hypothetical protein [Pseudomonadota bacterium]
MSKRVQSLASCDLVFDALDSIPLRLQLAESCSSLDLLRLELESWS